MLSGIGPKEDLEKLGIQVMQDLPVGKNLHDHVTLDGLMIKLNDTKMLADLDQMKNDALEYLKWHNNSLSAMSTSSSSCFVTTHLEETPNYPDMQFIFNTINITVRDSIITCNFFRFHFCRYIYFCSITSSK